MEGERTREPTNVREIPAAAGAMRRLGKFLTQLSMLALIIWIALIGIFAIEQIKVRDGMLRQITAREGEIAVRRATLTSAASEDQRKEQDSLDQEALALRSIKERLSALILTGAMTTHGSLPILQCDLVRAESGQKVPGEAASADAVTCLSAPELDTYPRVITLQTLTERSASGALFAVLVVTAALGGAVIRLSLHRDRQIDAQTVRSLLRAIGGGIVCYLVLDGGKFPFSSLDVTGYTSPATGSLLGLLSGMFSDRVFTLLSDLVDAFVARLTPKRAGEHPVEQGAPAEAEGASAPPAPASSQDDAPESLAPSSQPAA